VGFDQRSNSSAKEKAHSLLHSHAETHSQVSCIGAMRFCASLNRNCKCLRLSMRGSASRFRRFCCMFEMQSDAFGQPTGCPCRWLHDAAPCTPYTVHFVEVLY
jgi:hypothetical protein